MGVAAQDAAPEGGQDAVDPSLWDEASGSAQYAIAASSPPASSPPSASTAASVASNPVAASVAASSSVRPPSIAESISQNQSRHCSFVMLAEFDIDRGSTLSHVYPSKESVKSHDDQCVSPWMRGARAAALDLFSDHLCFRPPILLSVRWPNSCCPTVPTLAQKTGQSSFSQGTKTLALAPPNRKPDLRLHKPLRRSPTSSIWSGRNMMPA